MDPIPAARPRLSVTAAAGEAMSLARARLFPFRLQRWLPLGFVAFLDHCGREGMGGFQVPGGSGGSPGGATDSGAVWDEARGGLDEAKGWILEHLALVVAIGVALVLLLVAFMALVQWLQSRGVFMYIDNVASGRFDVARPWREHRDRAWSYFGWSFGIGLLTAAVIVVLLLPIIGWSVFSLVTAGASAAAIAGLVGGILMILAVAIAAALFSLVLRDFAAPLQLVLDVPCGKALGVAWGLVKGNVGSFVGYVVLKIVFGIVAAIIGFVAGCLTCCLGFLPVISHTLLQPLHYFERGWSLLVLRQAGYDVFAAVTPPPAPPAPVA